jgi:hypothetical protein
MAVLLITLVEELTLIMLLQGPWIALSFNSLMGLVECWLMSTHDHIIPNFNLPFGPVNNYTSNGTLWDPTGNYYAYSYDNTFTTYNLRYPVNWPYFNGQWGDMQCEGQTGLFGEYKYTSGPNGRKFKGLVRTNVCPNGDTCNVLNRLWV